MIKERSCSAQSICGSALKSSSYLPKTTVVSIVMSSILENLKKINEIILSKWKPINFSLQCSNVYCKKDSSELNIGCFSGKVAVCHVGTLCCV